MWFRFRFASIPGGVAMRGSLEASQKARQALGQVFGFAEYLPGQEGVVERLLRGKSVLAIFPTGGGKSLCYQLPAMVLDGLTLVISPLIALMKDQLDFLTSRGVPAARLDSSLDREATLKVYDDLAAARLRLLYVSPERLNNERFLQALRRWKIAMLAVDEAHCISQWGHNFRPDYLKIAGLARELRVGRVLTLTATATPQVAQDIAAAFTISAEDVINTGFHRPNLKLAVHACTPAERKQLLLSRLKAQPPGSVIIYVTLQRTAEQIAEFLVHEGYEARPYHAGMETDERTAVQDAFMASSRMIVVATIAFGMGVDKRDIRYVYHYNLPKSLESYSQEIGRAGRDGQESHCELFAAADDVVVLENFSYGDTPTPEAVDGLVRHLLSQGETFDISVTELSNDYDVRPLVVRTLLTYLELDGVLHSTGPFYTGFRFQPQRSSQEILAGFDPRRAEFLRKIFAHARKGKTWFSLDADAVAAATGESRQRIVAALGYLEERGDLLLEASGVREGYRFMQMPTRQDALAGTLYERFQHREEQDIARLRRVLDYAQEPGCLTQHLLDYFGEEHGRCGHCARCFGAEVRPLPAPSHLLPRSEDAAMIRQLKAEQPAALGSPRQMARFLCGITSPATTRAKLRTDRCFGRFESTPFHTVLRFVEEQ
jgi:ATP-dependent DNA helicase RecQ